MLPSSGYKTKKVLYPDEGSVAETSVREDSFKQSRFYAAQGF